MLYYHIADHTIAIDTPNAEKTAALLSNFAPFRHHRNGARTVSMPSNAPNAPLFTLTGETPLAIPARAADDRFDWNGIGYEVYHTAGGWVIGMKLKRRKQVLYATHDWKNLYTDLSLTDTSESYFLNNFLIVGFGMASAPRRTLKIHASVIEKNGQALLFLGKSGTGKSTHSRLWQEHVKGCTLLNDDEPAVRIEENNQVWVYGTPWSGKTPCYRNERARVAAFVQLYQHPENRLTALAGREAFSSIFASSCMMRTDEINKNHVFNTVADMLQHVPVYRLDCRPDREAVKLTEGLMELSAPL